MDIIKVNTNGLDWPLPLIELKKALVSAQSEQQIDLEFTCPEATVSLPNFCEKEGHEVLAFDKVGKKGWRILIKKK